MKIDNWAVMVPIVGDGVGFVGAIDGDKVGGNVGDNVGSIDGGNVGGNVGGNEGDVGEYVLYSDTESHEFSYNGSHSKIFDADD